MSRRVTAAEIESIETAARITASGAPELIRETEVRIINELVSAHSAGKLTDRDAAIGIAVIARLRLIFNKMQRAVTQGSDAGERLTRNP